MEEIGELGDGAGLLGFYLQFVVGYLCHPRWIGREAAPETYLRVKAGKSRSEIRIQRIISRHAGAALLHPRRKSSDCFGRADETKAHDVFCFGGAGVNRPEP